MSEKGPLKKFSMARPFWRSLPDSGSTQVLLQDPCKQAVEYTQQGSSPQLRCRSDRKAIYHLVPQLHTKEAVHCDM